MKEILLKILYNLLNHKFYLIPFIVLIYYMYIKNLIISINKKEGVPFEIIKIILATAFMMAILN